MNKPLYPYEIIKYITAESPNLFSEIAEEYEKTRNYSKLHPLTLFDLKTKTDVPVSVYDYTLTQCITREFGEDIIRTEKFPAVHASVTAWLMLYDFLQTKEVYSFSKEMQELLAPEGYDMKIPVEVLESFPFPAAYIELGRKDVDGFLISFRDDIGFKKLSLHVLFTAKNPVQASHQFINLKLSPGMTIKESAEEARRVTKERMGLFSGTARFAEEDLVFPTELLSTVLNLMVYLCCQNAEVKESSEYVSFRKSKPREISSPKYNESIRRWDVGTEITRTIKAGNSRARYERNTEESSGIGSPKRPHMRSGHWHSYWIGSKEAGKEDERKLIVKWLHPIYVNASSSEDIPIHKTKIEK